MTSPTPPTSAPTSTPTPDDNALALREKLLELESLAKEKGDRDANTRKGKFFERLIKYYLETDPVYRGQIGKVWLWGDWPGRHGPDTGIDLVAEDLRAPGPGQKFWAIQCKYVSTSATDSEKTLPPGGIDSFIAASGGERFTYRLLATTAHNLTSHSEQKLKDQKSPCLLVTRQQLEDSVIDWSTYDFEQHTAHKRRRKQLHAYQGHGGQSGRRGFPDQRQRQTSDGVRHGQDLHGVADHRAPRPPRRRGVIRRPVHRLDWTGSTRVVASA